MDEAVAAQLLAALAGVARLGRIAEGSLRGERGVPVADSVTVVLGLLAEAGELRLSQVAAGLGVDSSSASRAVAHAEQLGLLCRRPDPADGRACLLSLTADGARCLTQRGNRRLRLLTEVMGGWDEAATRSLVAGLTRLQEDLAAHCRGQAGAPPALPPRPRGEDAGSSSVGAASGAGG